MVHAGIWPFWDLAKAQLLAAELETVLRGNDAEDFLQQMHGDTPNVWDDNLTDFDRLRFITNAFTRMRFCQPDNGQLDLSYKGPIGGEPQGLVPWFDMAKRKTLDCKLLIGHWASLQRERAPAGIYPVDTGCVWRGPLTALRLEDEKEFSVAAQEKT